MTDTLTTLKARYAQAQERLDTADDDVRQASRARLGELMKLPERQRFAHLDDPDLTPSDRSSLRRSMAAGLSPPRVRMNWRPAINRVGRRLRRRLPTLAIAAISIAPLAVWGWMTWQNTGQQTVAYERPEKLNWTLPSGEVRQREVRAGELVVLVQHRSGRVVRSWLPKQGYETAKID